MATSPYRPHTGATFAPLADALLTAGAGWVAYYLRWDEWQMPLDYLSVLVLGTGLVLVILPLTGAYRTAQHGERYWQDIGNVLPGLVAVAVLLMVAGTLTKTSAAFSRLWMGYWLVLAAAGLLLLRRVVGVARRTLLARQRPTVRILLVGDGPFVSSIAARAHAAADAEWQIAGVVSTETVPTKTSQDVLRRLSLADMEALVGDPAGGIEELWLALDDSPAGFRKQVMDSVQDACITVRYIPDLSTMALLNHSPSQIAGMMAIDLNSSPLDGPGAVIKNAFDRLLAAGALLVLAPMFALIALLIRSDSAGPTFFRQSRLGSDGKVIRVLKFRTMYHDAPDDTQARRGDPRITRVGRWLRRSSLDELPQLINVLRGDMSLVGPRPHPLALNASFLRRIDGYMQRHRVKPGITGWAQVHGMRGETDTLEKMQQRVQYDLYYIKHWSMWLDIKILALTLIRGWSGDNAY